MKKKLHLQKMLLVLTTLFVLVPSAMSQTGSGTGDITYISVPDAAYTGNTTLVDLSSLPNNYTTLYNTLTQGDLTFSFTYKFYKSVIPDSRNTVWNTPPAVESATPSYLSTFPSNTIIFNQPLSVFGFEAQPFGGQANETYNITVKLYSGDLVCATISQATNGESALLFAAQTTSSTQLFDSAHIEIDHSLGLELANIRFSKTPYLFFPIPDIKRELSDVSICIGDSHTFRIDAVGDNLKYQWYKGNNLIKGANGNALTISNATKSDYNLYYVLVKNDVGSVMSNKARLWVAEPLPEQVKITQYPNPATAGTAYQVAVEGYPDITKYSWSYSLPGATFSPSSDVTKATVVFSSMAAGNGVISVGLEHVCGNRTATQAIQVKYPTGKDGITDNKIWVGPNPVATELNIESGNAKIINVIVTNLSGQNIYQAQPNTSSIQINTANWSKGVYFVKITSGLAGESNSKNYKIIKK